MNPLAKGLVVTGIILIFVGITYQWWGRSFPLGKLPGDITIDKGNIRLYFPITTCIILSVLLSIIGYFFRFFR